MCCIEYGGLSLTTNVLSLLIESLLMKFVYSPQYYHYHPYTCYIYQSIQFRLFYLLLLSYSLFFFWDGRWKYFIIRQRWKLTTAFYWFVWLFPLRGHVVKHSDMKWFFICSLPSLEVPSISGKHSIFSGTHLTQDIHS